MSDELVKIDRPDPPAEILVSIFKSAFGAVPVVGQALMEIVFDGRSRIKQERVNLLLKETADEIRREKVDYEFLKTDEFSDHLENILIKASINSSENKRKYLKNLLLSSIEGHKPPDMSRAFIDILSEITDAELLLLAELYKIFKRSQQLQAEGETVDPAIHVTKDDIEIFGIDYSEYVLMVQSMIRKGLLYDESMGRWGGNAYEFIRLNELGVRFYEYVTHT